MEKFNNKESVVTGRLYMHFLSFVNELRTHGSLSHQNSDKTGEFVKIDQTFFKRQKKYYVKIFRVHAFWYNT